MGIRQVLGGVTLLLALGLSGCGDGGQGQSLLGDVGTTMHDNEVRIKKTAYGRGISYVGFSYDWGYSITPGQPWQDPLTVYTDAGLGSTTIVAHAGRKSSTTPTDWYSARTTLTTGYGQPDIPPNANFSFSGTIDVQSDDGVMNRYPVVFQQYSSWFDNYWVVGGRGAGWTRLYYQCMVTPDQRYIITPGGPSEFEVWANDKSKWDYGYIPASWCVR